MNYINVVKNIDNFVSRNFDILEFLYLREGDCKYSILINSIVNGKTLTQLKKEIGLFYRFQGMDNKKRTNLLKLFDDERENIKNIDYNDINKVFNLYCKLLKKTEAITDKSQYVNTAKIINLYNQNLPLFDNNVINFLNHINNNEYIIEKRNKNNYLHILNIYKIINVDNNIPNIIRLKNSIYSDMEIMYINLNKFVDTLMYFINDTVKLYEYRNLCIKKGQTST